MVSGMNGFLALKSGSSSTASSVVKGIGYTPTDTASSFISSGSSKGLLSLTRSKEDRREDRHYEKMASEAQAFLLNNQKKSALTAENLSKLGKVTATG